MEKKSLKIDSQNLSEENILSWEKCSRKSEGKSWGADI